MVQLGVYFRHGRRPLALPGDIPGHVLRDRGVLHRAIPEHVEVRGAREKAWCVHIR